jgi:hypothetical protein
MQEPEKVDLLRQEVGLDPLSEATKRIQERENAIRRNREMNR